jgi:Cys-Gly metallodipeptidase DUG1
MTDLFALFSKLVTPKGEILVPGIQEQVRTFCAFTSLPWIRPDFSSDAQIPPLTDSERALYEAIDITNADFEAAVGSKTLISDDKIRSLTGRMREPSLSIHGIEGAFSTPGAKTVIPAKVKGASLFLSSSSPFLSLREKGADSRKVERCRQVLHPPHAPSRPRRRQRPRREVP